mmetsp:Transcript_5020/g.18245  ORF Transcript_5020/g.18245 Transcript_5020/m.18245 type:complete len:487 (-) Transcript_5020:338-1798(-)
MESLRVQGLSSGMLLELAGGTPYYFGIYESQLKSSLNFTQSQIDTVSSTGNLALYLSVEGGLLIDILGPKFLGCVAALLNFGGYFLLYQVVRGKVGASVGRVAAYVAIWQHGAGFMDNIAVVLTLKNFKHDSGKTIGLLKSFFGLSAAVFSCFTSNLLSMTTNKDGDEEQDLNQLFLFLTIVPCLLIALAFPGAKILPKDIGLSRIGNKERRLINIGYIIVILTTVYVTVVKLLQSQDVIGQSVVLGVCLLPFLVAIFSPALRSWGGLVSSCTTGSLRGSTKTAEPSVDKENNEDSLMEPLVEVAEGSDSVGIDNNASFFASIKNSKLAQSVTKNFDAWHAVIEINFWLLFISSTVGFGAGLMIINNIGDISKAIDISDDSVFVTMISVGNCCGRMFFGFSSDFFIHRISRPGFLLIAYLLMVVGFGLLAFTQQVRHGALARGDCLLRAHPFVKSASFVGWVVVCGNTDRWLFLWWFLCSGCGIVQ